MKTKIYSLLLLLLGLLPESIFAQVTYFNSTDAEGTVWKCRVINATTAAIEDVDATASPMFSIVGSNVYPERTGDTKNYNGDVLHIPSTVSDGTNTYTVTELIGLFHLYAEKLVIPATVVETDHLYHISPRRIVLEAGSLLTRTGRFAYINPNEWYDNRTPLYCDFTAATITGSESYGFYGGAANELYFFNAASINPIKDLSFFVHNTIYAGTMSYGATFNFVHGGVCDDLQVFDGEDFESPYSFTATKADYKRTFDNVAGKAVSTLYLPYPTDLPNGMRAYTLIRKGFDENGDKAFCFAPVPAGTRLEAYKPYLVQITDGASHTLPTMHNVTVPATPDIESTAVMASADSDWKFYGTTLRIKNDKAYAKKAYYLNGNKWWAVQNGVTNDYIAPFRCFISSPTGAVPAKSFLMVLDEEDNNTTGIKSLENKTNEDIKSGKYPFYSVDGKLIGNDYNALESGQIYIVNGKKFYKI